MCRILLCCGCLLAALAMTGAVPPHRPAPAAPAAAAAIVEAYVRACGGAALSEIESETRRGTLLRGRTGKVPLETAAAAGKWLYRQVFAFGDQVRYGFDGADAWLQDTEGVEAMSERQRLDLQLLLDVQAPLRLGALFPELAVAGTETVGDREAYTVHAVSAGGARTELAFDRETGLLLRAGGMLLEDYREVDGVTRPHRVRLGESDEESHLAMTLEFTETRHGEAVDGSQFRRPEGALPLADAPLYRSRREVAVGVEAMDACAGVYQHPDLADVTYTVRRWGEHLMVERTGWGQELEIKPESETDYFVRFLGWDFHFVKDAAGGITHLEIQGGPQLVRAERIR
jgi:hypothetical protein